MLVKSFDTKEPCHFYFESTLAFPIYTFVKTIFEDASRFQEQSEFIAKILYEKTSHPMTKSGELNIVYLSDCEIDGKKTDAIAMLKTENKQPAYQYFHTEHGYEIKKSEVISFSKVEKGCSMSMKKMAMLFSLLIRNPRAFNQSIGKTISCTSRQMQRHIHKQRNF